jgi:hypothetical protein
MGQVAHIGRMRNATTVLDNLKGRDHLRHSDTEGRTIIEWILQKQYID